jgi:hypothetical protein
MDTEDVVVIIPTLDEATARWWRDSVCRGSMPSW